MLFLFRKGKKKSHWLASGEIYPDPLCKTRPQSHNFQRLALILFELHVMFFFFLNQSYFRIILAVIEIEIEYLRFLVGDEGAKSCGGRKRKTNKSKLRWQSVKQCCRKTKNVTIKYLNIAPNFNVADSGIKKKKKKYVGAVS